MNRVNGYEPPLEGEIDPPAALLSVLRERLGRGDLAYAEPPRPLSGPFGGRSANEAYRVRLNDAPDGWRGPLVLRVYRGEVAESRCRVEARVHEALREQGYPAPHVRLAAEREPSMGTPFLVMDLLPGWNGIEMLAFGVPVGAVIGALVGRPILFGGLALCAFGALTASLMQRLHGLRVEPVARAIADVGEDVRLDAVAFWLGRIGGEIERLGLRDLEPAYAWLTRNRPAPGRAVVCHGDLHPGNLVVSFRGVGVLDWEGVAIAPPEYDAATTQVRLCAQADPEGLPVVVEQVATGVLWLVTRALYWIHALASRLLGVRLDRERLQYMRALQLAIQLVEVGRRAAGEDTGAAPLAARGERRMRRWLARITGTPASSSPGDPRG